MKKFLIVGSSLAAVAAAGSAGAVDVTLGGSIDMGIKYGVGKKNRWQRLCSDRQLPVDLDFCCGCRHDRRWSEVRRFLRHFDR
jgi:hypothetical protein